MPGAPFIHDVPSYQGVQGQGVADRVNTQPQTYSHTSFIVWLVVIGVLIPAAIVGGLRIGGFSFVFRHR